MKHRNRSYKIITKIWHDDPRYFANALNEYALLKEETLKKQKQNVMMTFEKWVK